MTYLRISVIILLLWVSNKAMTLCELLKLLQTTFWKVKKQGLRKTTLLPVPRLCPVKLLAWTVTFPNTGKYFTSCRVLSSKRWTCFCHTLFFFVLLQWVRSSSILLAIHSPPPVNAQFQTRCTSTNRSYEHFIWDCSLIKNNCDF